MAAMQRFMPKTVVEWETDDHPEDENLTVLRRVFWAYPQSIQGFEQVKPIVQVDGTFLYGKYKGALLMATSQDGNRKCFPLAFTLVEGETGEAWHFFLCHLRAHVVRTRRAYLCLPLDHRSSLLSYVVHHLVSQSKLAVTRHRRCLWWCDWSELRSVFSASEYRRRRRRLSFSFLCGGHSCPFLLLPALTDLRSNWIDNIPKEQWSLAYDGGMRYSHMTTNLAESMKAVFKGVRALPITGLVKATYYHLMPTSPDILASMRRNCKLVDYIARQCMIVSTKLPMLRPDVGSLHLIERRRSSRSWSAKTLQ
ncbi:putative transcription factor interactor and regulator CCHC(Zn) family [Senna tora]|uniref:Putative transcription factor interactor and regulator CCHC(Zn) family n=1 Tax=Senna tora TaxID=362788 RepID=A0A835CAZ4_9FABA|nr:putative transcription factor interactor and regulator CCHC(Zn) family [Senna tora]